MNAWNRKQSRWHLTLFTFFHFSRAVISNACANDLQSIYSLFPVALEERIFFIIFLFFFLHMCLHLVAQESSVTSIQ